MESNKATVLSKAKLASLLTTDFIGRELVEIYKEIDSTNLRARELGLKGEKEGALIVTETQTAGRGRLGRVWHSPAGLNLYFSILLRPGIPSEEIPLITLFAGLGIAEAVGKVTGITPDIKWPNDLLLNGRKIAGMLAEMEFQPPDDPVVVLGIGLNVNMPPDKLPEDLSKTAGSLLIATGREWDRHVLLAEILKGIEANYMELTSGGVAGLLERYRDVCFTLGAKVKMSKGADIVVGTAVDVDQMGQLVVKRDADGILESFNAGETTIIKPGRKK